MNAAHMTIEEILATYREDFVPAKKTAQAKTYGRELLEDAGQAVALIVTAPLWIPFAIGVFVIVTSPIWFPIWLFFHLFF